jgi:hypothetical protein
VIDTVDVPCDTFTYRAFDSGDGFITLPLSRLFIGGSFAFSPHDTLVDWTWDSTRAFDDPLRRQINFTEVITDSTTLISNLPDSLSDYHLPFDSQAVADGTIWSLWMRNNLDTLFLAAGASSLDNVNIWIAHNPGARWNYGEMTQSWVDFLNANLTDPTRLTVYPYSGFGSDPIVHDEYTYDMLRNLLRFHSESFGQ